VTWPYVQHSFWVPKFQEDPEAEKAFLDEYFKGDVPAAVEIRETTR